MFRDFFFTLDIESGYHHIDVNSNYWQYLGFSWQFSTGTSQVFCLSRFVVWFVFGLLLIYQNVQAFGRQMEISWYFSHFFISRMVFGCQILEAAQATSAIYMVKSDLESAGWKQNAKNHSKWDPVQRRIRLGIFIDSIRMLFIVPA